MMTWVKYAFSGCFIATRSFELPYFLFLAPPSNERRPLKSAPHKTSKILRAPPSNKRRPPINAALPNAALIRK